MLRANPTTAQTSATEYACACNFIEGAQMVVIPNAGHVALFDQPEAFCAALEAFLPVPVSYER